MSIHNFYAKQATKLGYCNLNTFSVAVPHGGRVRLAAVSGVQNSDAMPESLVVLIAPNATLDRRYPGWRQVVSTAISEMLNNPAAYPDYLLWKQMLQRSVSRLFASMDRSRRLSQRSAKQFQDQCRRNRRADVQRQTGRYVNAKTLRKLG